MAQQPHAERGPRPEDALRSATADAAALTPRTPSIGRPRYKTPVPEELYSAPPDTRQHAARRATGLGLDLIEAMMKSRIRVDGVGNLPKGPVLFVANHFTRFETFIVPWILDRATGRYVHNLAHYALFQGAFGTFLNSVGARSTKEPGIKDSIIGDLITGRHDWVIYPEGSMIKDKKVWEAGHFQINAPDRHGPPHTGAALMALQAALYKQVYLNAWRTQDDAALESLEERFHFTGSQLPREDLSIIPINITYYPLRPGPNAVSKLARLFLRKVPETLAEELAVEGNLLLGDTDISLYLGKPIALGPYLDVLMPAAAGFRGFQACAGNPARRPGAAPGDHAACGEGGARACAMDNAVDVVMAPLKTRLTNQMMAEIYSRLTINLDHLFCTALVHSHATRIPRQHLYRAIYHAARAIQATGNRRRHRTLDESLRALVTGEPFPPLDSIRRMAIAEGVLTEDGDVDVIDRGKLDADHGYHQMRVKNPCRVIANELEPLREAVKAVAQAINLPAGELRSRTASLLMREDQGEFQAELRAAAPYPGVKDRSIGQPFVLRRGQERVAVVLAHGYLASPGEVRGLAEHLSARGFAVVGVRLAGHGTAPEQLARTTWAEWRRSYRTGLAIARCLADRVVVGGFSMGGLLALQAAAESPALVQGVVTVGAPLALVDPAARLAPMVRAWNGLMHTLHLNRLQWAMVGNDAEWPDTNYDRNPVNGIYELECLMAEVRAVLPRVQAPTLILHADHDPVASPESAAQLAAAIASDDRQVHPVASTSHGILRGESAPLVHEQIAHFIQSLVDHWD